VPICCSGCSIRVFVVNAGGAVLAKIKGGRQEYAVVKTTAFPAAFLQLACYPLCLHTD